MSNVVMTKPNAGVSRAYVLDSNEINNTKILSLEFVSTSIKSRNAKQIHNVSYVLPLNGALDSANAVIKWAISNIKSFDNKMKPKRSPQKYKTRNRLKRLLRALRAAARLFWKWLLEELRRWHESNKTKYKFKYGFPKNKKELALLIRALANLYVSEFNNFLLFIALFDLLRFRILEKLWYAFFGKKWKVFFYLLQKMLKIPLVMLIISLATQNPYGGGTFLCYAIPFYLFLGFRIPVVSYLLENMFSEIFPAEVAQRAIASSTASIKSTALEFPLAKEILARLANSAKKFAEFANKKQK